MCVLFNWADESDLVEYDSTGVGEPEEPPMAEQTPLDRWSSKMVMRRRSQSMKLLSSEG
jgi:hypothetical protein